MKNMNSLNFYNLFIQALKEEAKVSGDLSNIENAVEDLKDFHGQMINVLEVGEGRRKPNQRALGLMSKPLAQYFGAWVESNDVAHESLKSQMAGFIEHQEHVAEEATHIYNEAMYHYKYGAPIREQMTLALRKHYEGYIDAQEYVTQDTDQWMLESYVNTYMEAMDSDEEDFKKELLPLLTEAVELLGLLLQEDLGDCLPIK